MKRISTIAVMMGLMVIFSGVLSLVKAQEPGWPGCMMRDQRAKNLENLRLLKLMEVLDLSDTQSPQFISIFVDFRKEMRLISDAIQKEVDTLSTLLQMEKGSDDAIKSSIAKIESLKSKKNDGIKKFHADIEKLLNVQQMGKVVVFEERFDRELIENVRGFRAGHMAPDSIHESNR